MYMYKLKTYKRDELSKRIKLQYLIGDAALFDVLRCNNRRGSDDQVAAEGGS